MTDEQTLLEWLRDQQKLNWTEDGITARGGVGRKFRLAADEIERLQAERDKLRKALESIVSNQVCHMPRDHKRSPIWQIASEALK